MPYPQLESVKRLTRGPEYGEKTGEEVWKNLKSHYRAHLSEFHVNAKTNSSDEAYLQVGLMVDVVGIAMLGLPVLVWPLRVFLNYRNDSVENVMRFHGSY